MARGMNPGSLIWQGRASRRSLEEPEKVKYSLINQDKIGMNKVDNLLKGDKHRHKGLPNGVMVIISIRVIILLHWSMHSL